MQQRLIICRRAAPINLYGWSMHPNHLPRRIPSTSKETLDIYLKLVYENSCYEHDHIKKAVSWALREIGKTDFEYAEKVLLTAYDLLASGNKVQIWIAKDVIKELETVVKVKERKRLITSNSKMGRER